MGWSSTRTAAVMLAAAGLLLTGCGGTTPESKPVTRVTTPAASATSPGRAAPPSRACLSVQALFGHLAADTTQWSPTGDPFDKTISSRVRTMAKDLAKQAPQAETTHLEAVVMHNSRALTAVADAMAGHHKKQVTRAIEETRVAYRQLKALCPEE
jgi:hypothetical protein